MDLKEQANKYFSEGEYEQAIKLYTELLDSTDLTNKHIILSNRSATYVNIQEYNKALTDAVECTKLKPDWGKAWARVGAALYGLDKLDEALVAYNKANQLEPSENYQKMIGEIKDSLTNIKNQMLKNHFESTTGQVGSMDNTDSIGSNPVMSNMFESMFNSVLSNSTIMEKLIDPDFQSKILSLQNNPMEALKDDDVMKVMNEMMKNINL